MTAPEVRLDRLRPAGIAAAIARAPIAWVPLGALEYHAPAPVMPSVRRSLTSSPNRRSRRSWRR